MKNNTITTVRIDRSKGMRGGKTRASGRHRAGAVLWDVSEDYGCCLGHAINQVCDIPVDYLDCLSSPADALNGFTFLTDVNDSHYRSCANNEFASKAMVINDKRTYSDKYRERRLIALFRRNGIKLEFYN